MKVLAISNLYPRPDRPQFGLFNAQLFGAMATRLAADAGPGAPAPLRNVCLVPTWKFWARSKIRAWQTPYAAPHETRYLPVFHLPLIGRWWGWLSYWGGLRECLPLARQADAIYSSWLYPDSVAGTRLAEKAGVPAWIMALGSDIFHLRCPVRRRLILRACRKARGIVCVSRSLADLLIAAGIEPARVHVIPNGVDSSLFHYRPAAEARAALQRLHPERSSPLGRCSDPGGQATVLFVGNLVPVKQAGLLLDAWAALLHGNGVAPGRPAQLLIAGDGPLRLALERQAQGLGIADSVVFLGRLSHAEIALWMNLASALCLCSRSEGMPNVVCEALASGLPIVATDVGALREMLEGEPAARLVPAPGCAGDLSHAIRAVLDQPADRPRLAERHSRYTWQDQADRILDLMKEPSVRQRSEST